MYAIPGILGLIVFTYIRPQEFVPAISGLPWINLWLAMMVGGFAMDISSGAATVRVAGDEVMPPDTAVIIVLPSATPVARPVASIVAFDGSDDIHMAVVVTSSVVPSERIATATKFCVPATPTVAVAGVTWMLTTRTSPVSPPVSPPSVFITSRGPESPGPVSVVPVPPLQATTPSVIARSSPLIGVNRLLCILPLSILRFDSLNKTLQGHSTR